MRRNNYNDNHILTPTERYQRMSMEGIKKIIDECWKIVKNTEEEECHKMVALQTALEANVQIANMLKSLKEQHYPAATTDHDNSYAYGAVGS